MEGTESTLECHKMMKDGEVLPWITVLQHQKEQDLAWGLRRDLVEATVDVVAEAGRIGVYRRPMCDSWQHFFRDLQEMEVHFMGCHDESVGTGRWRKQEKIYLIHPSMGIP